MKLQNVLDAVRVVGPVVAALPEFKAMFDDIVETFDSKSDQEQLKAAYERAVVNAGDAHEAAQAAVRDHS